MKKIYIIIGIAAIGFVAYMVLRKKSLTVPTDPNQLTPEDLALLTAISQPSPGSASAIKAANDTTLANIAKIGSAAVALPATISNAIPSVAAALGIGTPAVETVVTTGLEEMTAAQISNAVYDGTLMAGADQAMAEGAQSIANQIAAQSLANGASGAEALNAAVLSTSEIVSALIPAVGMVACILIACIGKGDWKKYDENLAKQAQDVLDYTTTLNDAKQVAVDAGLLDPGYRLQGGGGGSNTSDQLLPGSVPNYQNAEAF